MSIQPTTTNTDDVESQNKILASFDPRFEAWRWEELLQSRLWERRGACGLVNIIREDFDVGIHDFYKIFKTAKDQKGVKQREDRKTRMTQNSYANDHDAADDAFADFEGCFDSIPWIEKLWETFCDNEGKKGISNLDEYKGKLTQVNERDAATLGLNLSRCMRTEWTVKASLEKWVTNYPAMAELRKNEPWFDVVFLFFIATVKREKRCFQLFLLLVAIAFGSLLWVMIRYGPIGYTFDLYCDEPDSGCDPVMASGVKSGV